MLKGSAKIELVNADGTKEVVEHGNMITNAVSDLMYAARGEQSSILRICNNGDSFIEQLFGGILLFKHNLTDDAEDYYIPSVDTVGYANLNAYGGLDTERGGFNASESGLQEDGTYKLVWDFATSQANGAIKSIALCPNMMGRIGLSNSAVSSEKVSARTLRPALVPFDTNLNLLPRSGNTEGRSNYGYNVFAVLGDIAYAVHSSSFDKQSAESIENNGGVLKIFRFNVSASGVGLKSIVGSAAYIDCIDVQLPAEYVSELSKNYAEYSYDGDNKKLTLYFCSFSNTTGSAVYLQANSSIPYVEIEIANNMNVVLKTYTNTTGRNINMNGNNGASWGENGTYSWLYIAKDHIVSLAVESGSTAAKLYVCKKSDNTDVKEVKFDNGNEFTTQVATTGNGGFRPIFVFRNMIVLGFCNSAVYTSLNRAFMLDMSKGTLKEINASEMTYRGNIPLANKVTWGKTGTYLALSVTVNPFVLTTKNNLDAPVTKTASQTMKITYTLTETAGV